MHGLVKDQQGNKMSKTRGNVIDPVVCNCYSAFCDSVLMLL